MTYSTTFQKFTLATECDSYAPWVENINPHDFDNDTLAECAETAKSWTQDILSHAIDQIEGDFLQSEEYNEEGEEIVRGRTLEEAVEEMREDLPYLEAFLFDFITRDGDDDEVGEDETDTLEQADLSRYDSFIEEDEETSDEAYLGESTLSKIRRQKGLLLDDDRPEVAEKAVTPIAPDGTEHTQPRQGFFIATSSVEGRGGTPIGMIWAFSDEADFYRQNPHWVGVELPNPRWYGVIVKDTTLYIDGGFQLAWGGWHDCVIYSPHIYRP